MATSIIQSPAYSTMPIGQDVIFTLRNNPIVSNHIKVKFVANVYISSSPINISSSSPTGTFKITPNNAGVGIFDFRPILESFVNSDNVGANGSRYKGVASNSLSGTVIHPIHITDKFSMNQFAVRYMAIEFSTQYLNTAVTPNALINVDPINSSQFLIYNGYLTHSDPLTYNTLNPGFPGTNFSYGFDNSLFTSGSSNSKFLTNAPTTQYATINDYGTVGILNTENTSYLSVVLYDDTGSQLGSTIVINATGFGGFNNGAFYNWNSSGKSQLFYFGFFPANLRNWSSAFQGYLSNISYYTVTAIDSGDEAITKTYRVNILCPNLKGYKPIRLGWLNQWGAWDYYTFNMKSTRSIQTKGTTYQQQSRNWNAPLYRIDSFKGGKKTLRVNATEKITMNTDFVSQEESAWFEELINSPEVYIIEGYQNDATNSALNNYVTPVRLTTSSYTTKTVANDKVMQYTFEVEKTKTLRTQSV
jgi:hypothetical protein